ncbi:hypothetical protein BH11ACT8_BH11ACT8_34920 [soil metagenome]
MTITASHLSPTDTLLSCAPEDLTPREHDVIALVARGLSNQDIADELYLSINSVKTYIRSAYRKMGVTRRPNAIIWAAQHGLLQISTPVVALPPVA